MSNFIERLLLTPTGVTSVRDFMPPLAITIDKKLSPIPMSVNVEYKVDILFNQNILCLPEESHHALELVKRQITKALYQDFDKELMKMELALYENNTKKMKECMAKLYTLTGN